MGTGTSRNLRSCIWPAANVDEIPQLDPAALDETLGHSFCYVRSSSPLQSPVEIAFKSISGASVSANSSAIIPICDNSASNFYSFQSSSSFSSLPLQLAGDLDRGFFLSGPIEVSVGETGLGFSGPLVGRRRKRRKKSGQVFRRSFSEKNRPSVVPLRGISDRRCEGDGRVEWAQGKAGEDRVHVVVSEEQKWVFVGIYDGFNGAEAPEFLVENLYFYVFNELRGLFWEEEGGIGGGIGMPGRCLRELLAERDDEDGGLEYSGSGRFALSLSRLRSGFGSRRRKGKEIGERSCCRRKKGRVSDHELVLEALSRALEVAEKGYLEMTERAMECNPEMALMGSCLLVVLMRDEDVYVMNVGDSRAIVARYGMQEGEIEGFFDGEGVNLEALQLSTDHNTSIPEEIQRIKEEHPDDSQCIVNDRVKGRLKVTRAFGAGYLKQPKWNNGLLEMFRNDFIGSAPYVSCIPSLCHHKLGRNDQFLVLSSDGLYQYLSNEEVVVHVQRFIERFPDGDPAQSLIEELLLRAAKEAGMDFHELLDIPQGDRRKYHDDVTVMVISLEGRIWKSSGKYV